ncbi:MAG: tetratricopeptide repeat protein [Candidatus Obscuribacterales bacterium]
MTRYSEAEFLQASYNTWDQHRWLLLYTVAYSKTMDSIDGKTNLLRISTLSLMLSLTLAVYPASSCLAADLPMPADKSVAVPADADTAQPSAASPAASSSSGADTRPYAEEAFKHYNRGVELHQAGFLNQAIAEYKSAIEADARMEEAWSNLGGIYAAQRSYPKAMEAFEKALQLKPDRPTTLNGYGTVLYARGKTAEAKEKWKQAVQIEPGFASAYYNMGNALEGEKDIMTALAYYYLGIQANPNMADAYYRMGNLMQKDGHTAAAKVLLQKSIDLSPDAEFSREAKKQIAVIDTELNADKSDKSDVPMNVLPTNKSASKKAQATPEEPKKTASAKERSDSTGGTGGGTASKTKKAKAPKPKKEKELNMFVQTPAEQPAVQPSEQKPSEPDLIEKPANE